jgi:hypothetical protein
MLDVDMNAGIGRTRNPVENIIWQNKLTMMEGVYKVEVMNFCKREDRDQGFAVQIECQGQSYDFEFSVSPRNQATQTIAEFEYSKADGLKFRGEVRSNVQSRQKWGISTNQWHKATHVMLSPNHWEKSIGNKHFLFMLEGCAADEPPKPFLNEFLKPELDAHRKVLEVLNSKVKVEDSANQLSGLGFSETQRASIIARVTGQFKRILKVNF